MKEVDDDSPIWENHDSERDEHPDFLVDNPDYEDGFKWDCCAETGGENGCKHTKHKTSVNVIVDSNSESIEPGAIRKRMNGLVGWSSCAVCVESFDANSTHTRPCMEHPGMHTPGRKGSPGRKPHMLNFDRVQNT